MWIRKIFILSLIFCLFTSCISSTELNERAIVEGVGIDFENGNYTVTVQYFDAKLSDSNQSLLTQGSGKTISTALDDVHRHLHRRLYFGHNNLIVVGLPAAGQDIRSILKFFNNDRETNSDIGVLLCENANQVMELSIQEKPIVPRSILTMMQQAEKNGNGCDYRLYRALQGDISSSQAFTLPFASLNSREELFIDGCVLFKENRLIDNFGANETRGIQWVKGKMRDYTYTQGETSIALASCESRVDVYSINNRAVFCYQITTFFRSQTPQLSSEEKDSFEKAIAEQIKQDVLNSLKGVITKNDCDILSLTTHFQNKYTDESHHNGFDLREAKFEVNVTCKIR